MLSSFYCIYIKRFLDLIISILLIIILSPLYLVVSIIVFLDLGHPIIFKHQRPGYKKKIFELYKFRTMNKNDYLTDEQRISKIGYFIRKFSLDELPQLFNVIKGDMSLIGPRPLLVEYLNKYSINQLIRFEVKPGITGYAQINGRNYLSWDEKFNLDIYYVKNMSFLLDMKIFFKTIPVVARSKNFRSHGEPEKFNNG